MNTGATVEESTLKHNNFDLEGLKLMLYLLAYISHTLIILLNNEEKVLLEQYHRRSQMHRHRL